MGVPAVGIVGFTAAAALAHFLLKGLARKRQTEIGHRAERATGGWRERYLPWLAGAMVAGLAVWFVAAQVPGKLGVVGVLLVTPCVGLLIGSLSGAIVVAGRLQPFI